MKRTCLSLLVLMLSTPAWAQTSQTFTASAYGSQGCRAALLNVSKVFDSQGTHTWASYTVWTCAPGSNKPEQVVAQRSILIPDQQFFVPQGNQAWTLNLSTGDGVANLRWTPDGHSHSSYDQTWTSTIVGQIPTKTTKSVTNDSAPPTGTMFGLTPEAVSGSIIRGVDTSK